MFCTKCGKQVADQALICPNCNDRIAVRSQTAKVLAIKEQQRNVIASLFKSGAFLFVALATTFILIAQVASFGVSLATFIDLEDELLLISVFMDMGYVIPAIFATIATWKLYAHSSGHFHPGMVGGAKTWAIFQRILGVIFRIIFIIAIAISLTITFVTLAEVGDFEDFFSAFVVSGGLCAGLILFITFIIRTYEKIADYFTKLSTTYTTGEFYIGGAPAASLGILAGLMLTVALLLLIFIEALNLDGIVSPGMIIPMLAAATYLIAHLVFFQVAENKQTENILACQAEVAKLEDITAKTNAIISEAKKQERAEELRKEQAEKARQEAIARQEAQAKAEAAKAQAEATKAQQEMMQQMMFAMFQQNMANANANTQAKTAMPNIDPNMMAAFMAQMAQNNAAATPAAPAKEVAPTEDKE